MDTEIKQKWVEALRSGKYKQHHGSLFNQSRTAHCCLGVLRDVTGSSECWNEFLRESVGEHKRTLIRMNDEQDKSFAEIADYIEQNL